MFFKKKKRMVDIRELQKRGVVRIPKKETFIPTNKDGFVDLHANRHTDTPNTNTPSGNPFNFMDTPSQPTTSRPHDSRLVDLDNKIYKLEQRIELLEKKLDVNQNSNQKLGPMGW